MKQPKPNLKNQDTVQELQDAIKNELEDAPAFGSITVKVVFHAGCCQRLEVKRKTAKLLKN
jgi:hypothetical protein